jgi:hypothetical protein
VAALRRFLKEEGTHKGCPYAVLVDGGTMAMDHTSELFLYRTRMS